MDAPAHPLRELVRLSGWTPGVGGTLIGLVGRGIQASKTPAMHEQEAARLGLPYTYLLIDFDALGLADRDLSGVLREAAALGFSGLNITHPFKQAAVPLLDEIAKDARAIGAVNTVVFGATGRASGHNTDSWGFAESFRRGLSGVPPGEVVQFGAGGAGAAVAHALMTLGVEQLTIIDSDGARAEALATAISGRHPGRVIAGRDAGAALAAADGIVNTTPVGMDKYPGTPFPADLLQRRQWVAEIIYFPAETALLRSARAIGCRTLSGSGMAVFQAVKAFELFTGRQPDSAAMAGHFGAAA